MTSNGVLLVQQKLAVTPATGYFGSLTLDAELLEYLGVPQRELYHLADLLDLVLQAADVLVGNLGDAAERLSLF